MAPNDSNGNRMPNIIKDQKYLDELVVQELNEMSIQDRNLAYEEIHGVATLQTEEIEDNVDYINQKLQEMDQELIQTYLSNMTSTNVELTLGYRLAEAQNKAYIQDESFRIMFLRAESFHVPSATIRMLKYFNGKLHYFGPDSLTRNITLQQDFNKEDMECLKSGAMQWLPERDRTGRAVFCDFQQLFTKRCYQTPKSMVKCFLYFMFSAAEEVETQKYGIVGLMYHMTPTPSTNGTRNTNDPDPQLLQEGPSTLAWIPLRFTGLHVCVDNPIMSVLARMLLVGASREIRARSRIHHGTATEIRYSLMTFGIPIHAFPISESNGELKTQAISKWISKRKIKESYYLSHGGGNNNGTIGFDGIDLPCPTDVVLGKGKPFQQHVGNVNLRWLCEQRLEEYNQVPKGEKSRFALHIIDLCGGRFLKKNERTGWWEQVSIEMAVDKVIKTCLSIRAASPNYTTNNSTTSNNNNTNNNKRENNTTKKENRKSNDSNTTTNNVRNSTCTLTTTKITHTHFAWEKYARTDDKNHRDVHMQPIPKRFKFSPIGCCY